MKAAGPWGWKAKAALGAGLVLLALAALFLANTQLEIEGRWKGLFLLRSVSGSGFELQDDLFLGDGPRVVAGVSFSRVQRWLGGEPAKAPEGQPELSLEWDERAGRGVVRNELGDGRELHTMFGRYQDDVGGHPQGLFVGGAVPEVAGDLSHQDQSGMALLDRGQWVHIWCNVNEAIVDMDGPYQTIPPSAFRFLGSRVLVQDAQRVVLESRHEITFRRGVLRMERYAYFTAGQPFFKLGIRLSGRGPGPVTYAYLYGDEPWVGRFGNASGNLGWIEGATIPIEGAFDTRQSRWAGIVDLKSGYANFIEWPGGDLPDDGYFANQAGKHADALHAVPLASNEIFIGLQWIGRRLGAGEGTVMQLVLGLADRDPRNGKPRRPDTTSEP